MFDYEGLVTCTVFGGHFGTSGNGHVKIVVSDYIFNGISNGECEYNLYCPNGNTNSTCGKQIPTIYAEGPPVNNCRNYLWDYRL